MSRSTNQNVWYTILKQIFPYYGLQDIYYRHKSQWACWLVSWLHCQPVLFGSSVVSDLITLHRISIQDEVWKLEWDNLPETYAFDYRTLFKSIPTQPWFQSIKISRYTIFKFVRLRTIHSRLHTTNLKWDSTVVHIAPWLLPKCGEDYYVFHLILNCPSLSLQKTRFKFIFPLWVSTFPSQKLFQPTM